MLKKIIFLTSLVCFACMAGISFAQTADKGTSDLALEGLSQEYCAKGDYEGFYQYLKGLKQLSPEAYYYLALTRQRQIDSWKKVKNWEGVYDKGPAYKKDISENLKAAQAKVKDDPELLLNIKYLDWLSAQSALGAREDGPDRSIGSFNDLVNTARDTALSPKALLRVKAFADEISGLEDKNLARRLYEVYVAKLSGSGLSKEELKAQAQQFLSEGNAYLAKALFDAYLNSLSKDNELKARETVAVADKFANGDAIEGLDPVFAEEMYRKAYDLAGIAVFNSDSSYRRAFNLERMKEFNSAYDGYGVLLINNPDYAKKQDIYFRMGVIAAFAKKDIDKAEEYFLKIKDAFPGDVLAVSSLYQLGLLSQFKKDFEKAKEYYNTVAAGKNELALLAQERLKEIEETREFKYGLKLFLEGIFKTLPLSVDLTARPWQRATAEPTKFVVATSSPQTGCMTPVYSYEWSGETGGISNIPNTPELTTDYASAGIKVVYVAIVGPQGPEGVGFEIMEVKETK